MKASGVSMYFNCEDISYLARDYQATIDRLKYNIVDSVDQSKYMYSACADLRAFFFIKSIIIMRPRRCA